MRVVTQNAVTCFLNGGNRRFSNTTVVTKNGISKMYLFDNLIAVMEHTTTGGVMKITNAGWRSKTTKERLNGLPNVNIKQVKGEWFLNDQKWNGQLVQV